MESDKKTKHSPDIIVYYRQETNASNPKSGAQLIIKIKALWLQKGPVLRGRGERGHFQLLNRRREEYLMFDSDISGWKEISCMRRITKHDMVSKENIYSLPGDMYSTRHTDPYWAYIETIWLISSCQYNSCPDIGHSLCHCDFQRIMIIEHVYS